MSATLGAAIRLMYHSQSVKKSAVNLVSKLKLRQVCLTMCKGKVKLVLCLIKKSRLTERIGEWIYKYLYLHVPAALATKKSTQVGLPLE